MVVTHSQVGPRGYEGQMTQFAYLGSMVVMGVVLIAVVYALASRNATRMNRTEAGTGAAATRPTPRYTGPTDGSEYSLALLDDLRVWVLGFVALVLIGGGGSVAAVAGMGSPVVWQLLVACLAAVLALYLFVGTYLVSKDRGRPDAQAVAEGLIVLGGAFVLTVVATLVVG